MQGLHTRLVVPYIHLVRILKKSFFRIHRSGSSWSLVLKNVLFNLLDFLYDSPIKRSPYKYNADPDPIYSRSGSKLWIFSVTLSLKDND